MRIWRSVLLGDVSVRVGISYYDQIPSLPQLFMKLAPYIRWAQIWWATLRLCTLCTSKIPLGKTVTDVLLKLDYYGMALAL